MTLAVLATVFCGALAWQGPAHAGGPIAVGGTFGVEGQPFTWVTTAPIPYRTDLGGLGSLGKVAADGLTRDGFDVWQDVPTAAISFTKAGDLAQDVTGANILSLQNNPSSDINTTNAIIYDTDGSITDALQGVGASEDVLGFAGPVLSSNGRIVRARAVLNGKFIDGQPSPDDVSQGKFKEVFVHELGHFVGLDHSQVNVQILSAPATTDDFFGLPLMFPFLFTNVPARVERTPPFPPLAPDDEAWISFLYPSATFSTTFGFIEGKILFSDATTHVQGGNVIARQVNNLGTPENESRRNAVSVVSGYKFTGNPGQAVTGTNTNGSQFGARDPTLIGFYEIPLKPGDYTVEVESIDPDFTEGSSVGPLGSDAGEQFPLPGPAEFWDQGESATDDPLLSTPVPLPGPNLRIDKDIILNGTPTRFDAFESARLWLPARRRLEARLPVGQAGGREPAPAWVRREIPFDRLPAAKLWQAGLPAAKLWQAGLVTG